MKFAHLGDCHLGCWSQPELRALNFQSFQSALATCIRDKVEFILITGDLFDTAYPPIEVLKETFFEFRKIRDAGIPVFLIAGSHDYSASGKTFLDVLEKAGFCKNVSQVEERNGNLILYPTIYKEVSIYGYPGKKSGLEVNEIPLIKLDDSPGFFKILMLHTAIRDAIGSLPIDAIDHTTLPKVDYLALSHLHIHYSNPGVSYSGPLFPANMQELEELQSGCFYIIENGKAKRIDINLKPVLTFKIELSNALRAEETILSSVDKEFINQKIVILKISGTLQQGKITDIDFPKIERALKKKGAYIVLKSTSRLLTSDADMQMPSLPNISFEQDLIRKFVENNPSKYNSLIPQLLKTLHMEKNEEEKSSSFEERIYGESKKVLSL